MLRRALWGAKLYWDIEDAESWSGSILWDSIPRGGHSATDTQQRILGDNVNQISSYSVFQLWTNLLFGSLKTRGLFLARSSASFSFFALSGRGQKNSLNAKYVFLAEYFHSNSLPRNDLGTHYFCKIFFAKNPPRGPEGLKCGLKTNPDVVISIPVQERSDQTQIIPTL